MPCSRFLTTTMGIPCIYYGTEQQFDGHGDNDRFIREAMFGGEFGAFESAQPPLLRRNASGLSRGAARSWRCGAAGSGGSPRTAVPAPDFRRRASTFGLPQMMGGVIRSVVPWSRIFNDREVLLAVNTDLDSPRTAWVTIDDGLHAAGSRLTCLYSTDAAQIGSTVDWSSRATGRPSQLTVPPAGFVAFG